ncbi:MAG TPA: hypothetical protein VLB76_14680 [Thermoanaerobaculia bacterium]|nr:hypothetical protein [Thermoanaerobaculia bacterium]
MPIPRKATAGRICYRIGFVANPHYRGGHTDLFSDELRAEIRRRNVPESRMVHFDGRRARTEEVNVDYGVRSRSFELRVAGRDTITYCKEFPRFGFCVEHPISLPAGGPPPHLAPTDEMATIGGLRCRKAEYMGDRHQFVWYTEEVTVDDPTGAVLCLAGVPGLILQTEEIPASGTVDAVQQVTVVELAFDAPPPEIFSVPASYRRFADIDAARAEDRRILDVESAEELLRRPLGANERERFVGKWLLDRPQDKILVEIVRTGENEFQFRTTMQTAPTAATGRTCDEKATLKGRILMVEDPPNYRLYKLGDGDRSLILVGNEMFTFSRL